MTENLISANRTIEIIKTIFNDNKYKGYNLEQDSILTFKIPNHLGGDKSYNFYNIILERIANVISAKYNNLKKQYTFKLPYSELSRIDLFIKGFSDSYIVCIGLEDLIIAYVDIDNLEQFKQLREAIKSEYFNCNKICKDSSQFETDCTNAILGIINNCKGSWEVLDSININPKKDSFNIVCNIRTLQLSINNVKYIDSHLKFIKESNYILLTIDSYLTMLKFATTVSSIYLTIDFNTLGIK